MHRVTWKKKGRGGGIKGSVEAHWSTIKYIAKQNEINITSRASGFKNNASHIDRNDHKYLVVGRVRLMPLTKN